MPDLACGPAAGQTVTMRARLAAAGLRRAGEPAGTGAPVSGAEPGAGAADSARVAAARSRASERIRRQRQQMRPLAWAFIAAVVISGEQGRPAPGLAGSGCAGLSTRRESRADTRDVIDHCHPSRQACAWPGSPPALAGPGPGSAGLACEKYFD